MAEKRDEFHRSGGDTSQPHGTQGPPTDSNPDSPRVNKPQGVEREADHSTNPTNPVKVRPSHGSGAPGRLPDKDQN
jgi:hypothetical protein